MASDNENDTYQQFSIKLVCTHSHTSQKNIIIAFGINIF